MERQYISDEIGDAYQDWPENARVLITSPTGSGKSTFILQKLLPYAAERQKFVVYLCNRKILKDQINENKMMLSVQQLKMVFDKCIVDEVSEQVKAHLIVVTYQACEQSQTFPMICFPDRRVRPHADGCEWGQITPRNVMYYVFDEAHYFVSDAAFNSYTGFWEKKKWISGRTIYLSATPEPLRLYLSDFSKDGAFYQFEHNLKCRNSLKERETNMHREWEIASRNEQTEMTWKEWRERTVGPRLDAAARSVYEAWVKPIADKLAVPDDALLSYTLPRAYEYIKVSYFSEFEQLLPLILKNENEKWLIFVSNEEEGRQWKEKLNQGQTTPRAVFVSSQELWRSKAAKGVYQELVKERCFHQQVLIATSVIDNGIDIIDDDVKHIVIDHPNKTEFLQMLGRKRVKDNETVNLYLKSIGIRTVNCLRNKQMELLKSVLLFFCERHNVTNLDFSSNSYVDVRLTQIEQRNFVFRKRLFREFRKNFEAYYLPYDLSGGESAAKMYKYLNEFEINGLAVLNSAYMLYLYDTAIEHYHQSKKDPNFYLKEQLAWLGKTYDETAWVNYQETNENKLEAIKALKDVLSACYASKQEMDKKDQKEFAEKCLVHLQNPDLSVISLQRSKYAMEKKNNGIGKNLLNKAFEELNLGYLIASKQVGRGQERHTVWYVTKK